MRIDEVAAGQEFVLNRITLDMPVAGFEDFITPWLIRKPGSGRSILVDPGPACCTESLLRALRDLAVANINLILLTHIHIDHSGGIGALLQAFPEARIVVHPRGVPHLIDPSRLWASTVATLGSELSAAYGEISPVPVHQILDEQSAPHGLLHRLRIVQTPGHSPHHQSYVYESESHRLIFSGEAAGVYLGQGYLRPATPPKFLYDVYVRSMEALLEHAPHADLMLYGHLGYVKDAEHMLRSEIEQIALWKEAAATAIHDNPDRPLEETVGLMVQRLLRKDPRLSGLRQLPAAVQDREMYFLRNSARGFALAAMEAGPQET